MNPLSTASPTTAVGRLRHSVELRRQADIDEVQAIAELATEHSWTTTDEYDVIGERAVRLGADGCRLVGEFLPLEVAAVKGISVNAATWLIRDVLNKQGIRCCGTPSGPVMSRRSGRSSWPSSPPTTS